LLTKSPLPDVSPIRFRLLGPVEFFDGRRWSSIGAAKQRTLLAILLLNANRVVPVQQLYAELWGDKPRTRVSGLLAGCVWRLRAALGDDAGRVLVTKAAGYQLVVEPESLDLDDYRSLVATGRSRRAANDEEGALAAFTAALDLWRGAPLADVALTPSVMAETARLEESRLAVVETRLGLQITLGQPEEVLPEVKLMVSQHPLRERLHEHLMMALYRSGQQADALGAYRDLRRLLIDELGIEPSKPLRDLQRRILAEDPELAIPSPRTEIVEVAPRLLPPLGAVFLGRTAELTSLTERLVEDNAVCAVHGIAGSGKSALALRAAHAVADRFPDGQLHVDLRGTSDAPLRALDALGALLGAFGVRAADDLDHAVAQWTSVLAGRRVLVVLDDVRDVRQVRPLIPAAPGCAVLLTGRSAVGAVDGGHQVRVGRLSVTSSLDLLRRLVGADRVDTEQAAAADVARLCEYLPLALRVAAARLATRPDWTMADFAERLAEPWRRLDLLVSDDLSVRDSLRASVRRLRVADDRTALSALSLLGALDLPVVTVATLAALLDAGESTAQAIAERLVDAGLLESLAIERYRVPGVVRLLATEEPAPTATEAVQRVVDHYIGAVRDRVVAADEPPRPVRHRRSGTRLSWYREHSATLRALAVRDQTDSLHKAVDKLRWTLLAGATPAEVRQH
jgi:DNA-binding SARP family transcriptional activator